MTITHINIARLLAVISIVLASGCSNVKLAKESHIPTAENIDSQAEKPVPGAAKKAPSPAGVTEDTLYKLIVAEIAGQRGDLDLATSEYMSLARQYKDPSLAERATRIMIYSRKDKEALEAAKLWVQYAPENMEGRQILAAMHIRNNLPDQALQQIELILDKHPEDTGKALQMLANFLNRDEDKTTAMSVMDRLMENRQNDVKAMFAYGLLTLRAGDTDKARSIIEAVTRLDPTEQNYQMVYLSILEKDGDKQAALKYLENLLQEKPDDFNLRIAHARLLADLTRYDEALNEFKALTISHPDSTDARYALALLYLQTNNATEAKNQFNYLIKKQVLVNESSYYLGQIAEFDKEFKHAINWYQAVDNSSPQFFDAQVKIAVMQARLGEIDNARQQLTKIKPQTPNQELQLVRVEADILIEQGKLNEAMAVYDKAIGDGRNPDLLYSRAMLAEKMARIDLLERDLRTIIEDDPDNADVLNALGYTLADRTKRYQEAYGYIKRALELSPNNFYILDSMGWVLYRLGRLDESVEHLRKARALNDDPEVSAHLSEVLWVKGEKQEAREVLDNALKAKPEDKKLLEVLKRLNP